MKSLLLLSVIFYIMVQIEAYRLPGLGHFKKSNEPHPTLEIGKFLYSLRNVHDLFKTSSNQMQGTRDGPTIPPSSQISINEGKTVISIGASEKKRSSRSQFLTVRENLARSYKFENCCCCCCWATLLFINIMNFFLIHKCYELLLI